MRKYKWLVLGLALVGMLVPAISSAQHAHGQGSGGSSMKMDTREVLVEGLKVTLRPSTRTSRVSIFMLLPPDPWPWACWAEEIAGTSIPTRTNPRTNQLSLFMWHLQVL